MAFTKPSLEAINDVQEAKAGEEGVDGTMAMILLHLTHLTQSRRHLRGPQTLATMGSKAAGNLASGLVRPLQVRQDMRLGTMLPTEIDSQIHKLEVRVLLGGVVVDAVVAQQVHRVNVTQAPASVALQGDSTVYSKCLGSVLNRI
jgi:hypothetical protein